jgi:hypothetical protein
MPRPRDLVILAGLAAMQASAALPLTIGIGFLAASGPFLRPEALLLGAAFLGVIASLVAVMAGKSSWIGRATLGAGAILGVVLPAALSATGIGGIAALLLALGAVYWRGIALVMAEPEAEDIVFRFSMGLGLFVIGCVVVTARGMMFEPRVAALLTVAGVIFVLAALVSLAAAALQRSLGGGGIATSVGGLALFLAAVAGLAVVAYRLVTSHIGGTVATILSPIWDALTYGLAFGLAFLLSPLFSLIERTHYRLPRPVIATPNTLGRRIPTPTARGTPHVLISHSTDALLAAIVIGIAILLLVVLIWRTSSVVGRRPQKDEESEREPIEWSPAGIWRGLLTWVRSFFHGTVEAAAQTVHAVRTRITGPSYPSDPVRHVYAQILHRASVNGLTRPPATTPLEFQAALSSQWPDGAPDFAAITEAYIRRRYGEMPSGGEEITRMREHWQHLRTIMRRPKPAT